MKKYILVEIHDFDRFVLEVNKKIKLGYVPIGGVTCPVRGLYLQAMAKRDNNGKAKNMLGGEIYVPQMPDDEIFNPYDKGGY